MNGQQLVTALRKVVRDRTISEEISLLTKPPGRQPPEKLKESSAWYRTLDDEQKRILTTVIEDVADRAIFGVLCVLDGVRAVEDGDDKGRFELHYVKGNDVILNPTNGEMLHESW